MAHMNSADAASRPKKGWVNGGGAKKQPAPERNNGFKPRAVRDSGLQRRKSPLYGKGDTDG